MRKLKLDELQRVSVETFKAQEKFPIICVLDDIRSALNVGSIFRTADALGIEAIYLCGISAQPPHKEINKTAIGATQSVEWTYFENVEDAMQSLLDQGYTIAALEQTTDSTSLSELDLTSGTKLALVLGNEVNGVSEKAISMSSLSIEIPQFGTKHSFNVSVSAGIAIWEILRSMKLV